ncbi:hypothetical protein FACS1894137_06770 [Spirochaetia bacterium]|nr:hypothetical protein FACS1894137_06770 [Spirochaetia bacterium]
MRESTGSRPSDLGIFLFILTTLALGAGALRKEPALFLIGGVLLAVLGYSFLAALILSLLHSKRARLLSPHILNRTIPAGKTGEILLNRDKAGRGRFFRLPGILIRYEIRLMTRDGREIRHLFDPDSKESPSVFPVPERGAYYGGLDRFFIGDILGLLCLYLPLPSDLRSVDRSAGSVPRILALPQAAAEPLPVYIRSGGETRRQHVHYHRTDNLIDHRPYVPGDDPRRINWKLYGHAPSNELFIREGEPEPPPHSRLLILVDTLADPALYSPAAGRRGVDLLCENALAIALDSQEHAGMEISIGYSGGGIVEGANAEAGKTLAEALAYPAAYPPGAAAAELPASPAGCGVLVLALPRTITESALDRFLKNRPLGAPVDLAFLYGGAALEEAAETCMRLYKQRGGVYARRIWVRDIP